MRDAHGDTESRLPVAGGLVAAEIHIPCGNAVQLVEHTLSPLLIDSGLRLLCRRVFAAEGKHIYARHGESAVVSHRLSYGGGLRIERGLSHQMSREEYSVFFAPGTYVVRESLCKSLRRVIVIAVPCI